MTEHDIKELSELKPGDIVRHKFSANAYTVTSTEGGKVKAVREIEISNPPEWVKIENYEAQ